MTETNQESQASLGSIAERLRKSFKIALAPLVFAGTIASIFSSIAPVKDAVLASVSLYAAGMTCAVVALCVHLRRRLPAAASTNAEDFTDIVDDLEFCSSLMTGLPESFPADPDLGAWTAKARSSPTYAPFEQDVRNTLNNLLPGNKMRRYAIYYGSPSKLVAGCKDNWRNEPPDVDPSCPGSMGRLSELLLATFMKGPGLLIQDIHDPKPDDREIATIVATHLDGDRFRFFGWYPIRVNASRSDALTGTGRLLGALLVQCTDAEAMRWAGFHDRAVMSLCYMLSAGLITRAPE